MAIVQDNVQLASKGNLEANRRKGGVDKGDVGAGCVVAGVLPEDHTLGHHLQCTLQTPLTNQLAVLLSRTLVGEGVERLEEIVLGQVGGAYLNHANVT